MDNRILSEKVLMTYYKLVEATKDGSSVQKVYCAARDFAAAFKGEGEK